MILMSKEARNNTPTFSEPTCTRGSLTYMCVKKKSEKIILGNHFGYMLNQYIYPYFILFDYLEARLKYHSVISHDAEETIKTGK